MTFFIFQDSLHQLVRHKKYKEFLKAIRFIAKFNGRLEIFNKELETDEYKTILNQILEIEKVPKMIQETPNPIVSNPPHQSSDLKASQSKSEEIWVINDNKKGDSNDNQEENMDNNNQNAENMLPVAIQETEQRLNISENDQEGNSSDNKKKSSDQLNQLDSQKDTASKTLSNNTGSDFKPRKLGIIDILK
ncbi:MAG: hypothetical protein ACRC42_02130, partial [Mycoplasma sp.]